MKKVLLVNGSPHKEGCVYTALSEVAETLGKNGIETQIYHIGVKPVRGCIACGKCRELKKCVFEDDNCNELLELMQIRRHCHWITRILCRAQWCSLCLA